MIHIGTPVYYQNIRKRLELCDVIFVEGVNSSKAAFLAWFYRFIVYRKSLGLVTQKHLDLSAVQDRGTCQ